MDYFYQFLTQICIWVLSLTKDSCKNSQRLWSDCTCGHSSLAIYHLISTKSHAWITFIKLSPMFCLMKKKMATIMAATCWFARVDTWTWSFITQFLLIVIYGLLLSNYCSCLNMGFVRKTINKMVTKTEIPFHCRTLWVSFVGVWLFLSISTSDCQPRSKIPHHTVAKHELLRQCCESFFVMINSECLL